MKLLDNILKQRNNEKTIINNNRTDIQDASRRMLDFLLGIGILCFSLLFTITFFAASYYSMRIPYLVILLILLLFQFLHKFKERFSTLILLYLCYSFLTCIAMYTSSFLTYNYNSALIIILLFQIPIVILDRSLRVNLFEIMLIVVYICFIISYKNEALVIDECVNTVITGIIAMFLGGLLRKTQLDNFDLKRQAVIRENTDALTGLGNRRKLFNDLTINEHIPVGRQTAGIAMIDIDNFKLYNDTYGHQAGDECLQRIADCFFAISARHNITFYRYGGEEFVGVTLQYQADEFHGICQELLSQVYQMHLPHKASCFPFVTVSIGLSYFDEPLALYYELLLSQADLALYEAKRTGRNKVAVYEAT